MYFVYVLRSVDGPKTYVGITDNLTRRLSQHNSGYHAYTKRYKPWIIVYTETCVNREAAHIREKYFKSSTGRRWMKKYIFNHADVAELVYAQS